MVKFEIYPSADFGTAPLGSCCDAGVKQLCLSHLRPGLSTLELRSTKTLTPLDCIITPCLSAILLLQLNLLPLFQPQTLLLLASLVLSTVLEIGNKWCSSVAGRLNGPLTFAYLQHAWITWITPGPHSGYRRVNLNTPINDMFLDSDIYNLASGN